MGAKATHFPAIVGTGSLATPTSVSGLTEFFYVDTNGDGSAAPIDVLLVINFLNAPPSSTEGEGYVGAQRFASESWHSEPPFAQRDKSLVPRTELHFNRLAYAVVPTESNSVLREKHRRSTVQAADFDGALEQFLVDDTLLSFDDLVDL